MTNVGRELVPCANQMLRIYKEIKNITSEQNGVSGKLIIGAGETLSIYRLGAILNEYKKAFKLILLTI